MTRVETQTTDPETVGSHAPAAVQSLKQAMRRARVDNAERTGVVADLRAAQLGRLELLQEALKPLMAQIPPDVDIFDVGVMPGATPRLFIDMIGFVELGRDARVYRFFQDARHGRVLLAETADVETMVDAVTDYIARRMLERDKALAADTLIGAKPTRSASSSRASRAPPAPTTSTVARAHGEHPPAKRAGLRWFGIAFAFLIDLLGAIAFFTILAAIAWVVWNKMHTPI